VGDGAQFLRTGSELFDIIIVEAADAGQSPAPSLASAVFLATLHSRLSGGGMLAVNSFGDASPTFARRVAERFGQNASALLELTAEDPSSVHTIVFAQKDWKEGVAAGNWRARLKGGAARLCGADLVRHAADHLRAVS
jgi:spermidine synthase